VVPSGGWGTLTETRAGDIRYLEHLGGQVAYSVRGEGPVLICDLGRLHDLERFWGHRPYRRLVEALSHRFTVVQLDRPGCGQSRRAQPDFSLAAELALFDHLLDHLGLELAAVFASGTSAEVMLAVAALRPGRLSRLAVFGARATAHPQAPAHYAAQRALLQTQPDLAIRMIAQWTAAGGTETTSEWLAETYQRTVTAEVMGQFLEHSMWLDVRPFLARVRCPTLVLHRREDPLVDFSLGREVAAGIAGATLLPLDGDSGLPWEGDRDALLRPVLSFFSEEESRPPGGAPLSAREREVALLVALGLTNEQIAQRLGIGRRTVEGHVQRARERLRLSSRAELAAWSARRSQEQ
jgi:pimeloyl-ACP methyl ester carboxylesterase/DNA-binding CsgD family transcriptional regulator